MARTESVALGSLWITPSSGAVIHIHGESVLGITCSR